MPETLLPHEPAIGSTAVRVVALTAYPASVASARVRIVDLSRRLEPLGIDLEFRATLSPDDYASVRAGGVSVRTVGKMLASVPLRLPSRGPAGLRLIHRLPCLLPGPGDAGSLDVYDFDDALYLPSTDLGRSVLGRLKGERARSAGFIRRARLVLAGNAVLASGARELGARRVEVVPSCVDPHAQERRCHRESEELIVGWIGSPTGTPYLRPVVDAVRRLRNRGSQVRLVLMGASTELREPWIEHRVWSVEDERRLLTQLDVGVMPLPDDPWTRGKCGYKLLQYGCAGLPSVASPVGINSELLADGRGVLVRSDQDWLRALEELAADTSLRASMGHEARAHVERQYSYEVWAPRVGSMLKELVR